MNWNRDLDQVEAKTLHDLKIAGYKAVDKKHIIHFKEIYDFISRFADEDYGGQVRLSMTSGAVPIKTMQIVNKIGAGNVWLYFSPHAYPNKFYRFCEKLILTRHIRSEDYLAKGEIIAENYEVEVVEYNGRQS